MPEIIADLDLIFGADAPAFALLHRPESTGEHRLDLLVGDVTTVDRLADLPLPELTGGPQVHDVLAVVPYRQIAERGFAHHDDGAPLLALTVRAQGTVTRQELEDRVGDVDVTLIGGRFDIDDDAYAALVGRILADEIGRGEGSNFVIKRSFTAQIDGWSTGTALAIFRRLLAQELGAYWTFVVHTGTRTFIGATPERHVSVQDGSVVMNPISGTYRYGTAGPSVPEALRFLSDHKEADELYMVVDEELKMMARVCAEGGRVVGPYLKEMARLAHTEYFIEGRSDRDVRDIIRETMFAPTVTGSPLESAFRVISRYEPTGRGYYGGIMALIGRNAGRRTLDSAILIRTVDVDPAGRLDLGVGATLVRHSDARSEVEETRTKAAAMLATLGVDTANHRPGAHTPGRLGAHLDVRLALADRNVTLSRFWLEARGVGAAVPELVGRRVLVVDAEDMFTAMLAQLLCSLGPTVDIRGFGGDWETGGYDVVVVGPGPGDPRDLGDPKMAALWKGTRRLLEERVPFLSVCLGHQVLAHLLGFELARRDVPNQGVQREVDFFGRGLRVGFYNTFEARCAHDEVASPVAGGAVRVSRDRGTGEVYGLRGPAFRSVQFHPESVLTQEGPRILAELLMSLPQPAAV